MANKYALVTGASKGIGQAIAIALSKQGYDLFIHYNSDKLGAIQSKKTINGNDQEGYLLKFDLNDMSDITNGFERISSITDTIDIVVNNAGTDIGLLIEQYSLEQMENIVNVNLLGPMRITKEALPYLKNADTPKIINIASRMGSEKLIDGVGPYAASKAGLIRFTKCCALEFRDYNLKANVVSPGLTDTKITRAIIPDQSDWDEAASMNPSKRVGQPEDVAKTVAWLASEDADYINGEVIGVNGGSNLL